MSIAPSSSSPLPRPQSGWRASLPLLGLPVLALLWAGASTVAVPVVADALTEASAGIVSGTGADGPEPWLRVEAEGRDLLALGEAPDGAARATALVRLAAIPGLRRVSDRTGLIETVSPFLWSATRVSRERVEFAGSRPAEIGAAALSRSLAPALPPETQLRDRARAARGGPPGFPEAAVTLTEHLRGLAPGAVAALSDTALSLDGEALDADAYEAARGLGARLPRGFTLGTVAVLPPRVADFRFIVERRPDGGLGLSGHTVSEAARAEIRAGAEALAAGAALEDGMRTARGLPERLDAAALTGFALRLAGLLHDGRVSYADGGLSVSGNALDEEAVGEVEALMREARPAGLDAGPVALTARPVSPYVVRVRRDADGLTLSGHLPDRAMRAALLAGLQPRFPRETIRDRTRIAAGGPPGLRAALDAGLDPLAMLASGEVVVSDASLRLTGQSLYAESAARLREGLARPMPPGWRSALDVTVRDAAPAYDAATCARLFAERTGHPLRFAPGSSELRPDFYPVLDAVAELARACRSERIEVAGHPDPKGAAPKGAAAPKKTAPPEARAAERKAAEDKAKPGKGDAGTGDAGKGDAGKGTAKNAAKVEAAKVDTAKVDTATSDAPKSEPAPEADTDLPRARALAVIDYLLKAGLAPRQALAVSGSPPPGERPAIGWALRS